MIRVFLCEQPLKLNITGLPKGFELETVVTEDDAMKYLRHVRFKKGKILIFFDQAQGKISKAFRLDAVEITETIEAPNQ